MHIRNRRVSREAKGFDDFRQLGVVAVADARKEMVLDLVIEATVDEAQPSAAYVGRRGNLLVEKRGVVVGGVVPIKNVRSDKIVANDEKEGQVIARDHKHGADVEHSVNGWGLVQGQSDPSKKEEDARASLEYAM